MVEMLSGDSRCRKDCKYVAFMGEKLAKTEELYKKKCKAYDKVLYVNTDLRKENTSLKKEVNELRKKLKVGEKKDRDVSRYKNRMEELEKRINEYEVTIRKYEKQNELAKEFMLRNVITQSQCYRILERYGCR